MTTNSKQGLEPLVCNEPKILILGSLPSDISIESQEYYANHKNFFWRIIATITGSPVPLSYPAKKEMLAQSHIALWDVYAAAERIGSSDGNIRGGEFNDIVGFIRKNPTISTIVFNGKKAAKSYAQYLKKHPDTINIVGHLHTCACPSTSPAILCTGLTFDDLVNRWKDILICHKLFLYERKTCQWVKAHKKGIESFIGYDPDDEL